MKSYICPNCKKKQTTVLQWETVSVQYLFDLTDDSFDRTGEEVSGDHEAFTCPSCYQDIEDPKLIEQLTNAM